MPKLSHAQKELIANRWQAGDSQTDLASTFGVSRRTISRTLQETGQIEPDGLHHKLRRNGKNIFTEDQQKSLILLKTHGVDSQMLQKILTSPALTTGNMVKAVAGFDDTTTVNFLHAVRNHRKIHATPTN